jgi:starvation-inducible DNA-binding protein
MLAADMFALYPKTKNFHLRPSEPHFRDHRLFLADQADQIFVATDVMAELVRKLAGTTTLSAGHIGRPQRILDSDADYVVLADMRGEMRDDGLQVATSAHISAAAGPSNKWIL